MEALTEYLPVMQGFLQRCPRARMVTILDPVAGVLKLAQVLRERFPSQSVGKVHGLGEVQRHPEATVQRLDGYDRGGD